MSLVNAVLNPNQVIVFTDTLVMSGEGNHVGFEDKAHLLTARGIIIAGRGASHVISSWVRMATMVEPVGDIDALANAAPIVMQAIYRRAIRGGSVEEVAPATFTLIYQWGWSEADQRFKGYCHDSRKGFEAVALTDGLTMSPGLQDPPAVASIDDLDGLALAQHDQDRASARPSIGGDLIACSMTWADGPIITIARRLRFPTFDADLAAMPSGHADRQQWLGAMLTRVA